MSNFTFSFINTELFFFLLVNLTINPLD